IIITPYSKPPVKHSAISRSVAQAYRCKMPLTKPDISRKYLRWYFCTANQPHESQTKGVPVKLLQSGLFGSQICLAVVKDMSLGGAGLLAPVSKTVPDLIVVKYDEQTRIKAEVVYRRQVSD